MSEAYRSHVCDDRCAHTIDVGHVHTPEYHGGPCKTTCSHPDHATSLGGAYATSDWCLTCREAADPYHRAVHGVTHQTVYKPVAGWGTCLCLACKKAEAQMLANSD